MTRPIGRPRKLSPALVKKLKELRATGMSYRKLAAMCDTSAPTVRNAMLRED